MKDFFPRLPPNASTVAHEVDDIYLTLTFISVVITLGIFIAITIFIVKYKKGSAADRSRPPTHNLKLELTWIIIPLFILLPIFAWSGQVFYKLFFPPPSDLEIFVVGKQWMWKFQHPSGAAEINELHVPINKKVKLVMISQDVIHSFFVPAFRVKQDVLPGRYTTLWFEATQPGNYHLFCTEYCGTAHSDMIGRVVAMEQGEYTQWLEDWESRSLGQQAMPSAPGRPLVSQGRELFERLTCHTCHRTGENDLAPALEGLYGQKEVIRDGRTVVVDESYIRESILYPARKIVQGFESRMPSYLGQISEEELIQLISYIKSLTLSSPKPVGQAPAAGSPAAPGEQEGQVDQENQNLPEETQDAQAAPTATETPGTPSPAEGQRNAP